MSTKNKIRHPENPLHVKISKTRKKIPKESGPRLTKHDHSAERTAFSKEDKTPWEYCMGRHLKSLSKPHIFYFILYELFVLLYFITTLQ